MDTTSKKKPEAPKVNLTVSDDLNVGLFLVKVQIVAEIIFDYVHGTVMSFRTSKVRYRKRRRLRNAEFDFARLLKTVRKEVANRNRKAYRIAKKRWNADAIIKLLKEEGDYDAMLQQIKASGYNADHAEHLLRITAVEANTMFRELRHYIWNNKARVSRMVAKSLRSRLSPARRVSHLTSSDLVDIAMMVIDDYNNGYYSNELLVTRSVVEIGIAQIDSILAGDLTLANVVEVAFQTMEADTIGDFSTISDKTATVVPGLIQTIHQLSGNEKVAAAMDLMGIDLDDTEAEAEAEADDVPQTWIDRLDKGHKPVAKGEAEWRKSRAA